MPLTRLLPALVLSSLSLLAGAPALADPVYTLTFLPDAFTAAGINNGGQVIGTYGNAAAILDSGGITSLAAVAPESFGQAINDGGTVAGASLGNAFTYGAGVFTPISPLLGDNYPYSNSFAINNGGTLAGTAYPFIGEASRGFVVENGSLRLIPTFGGDWSAAAAINASGAVAGTATLADSDFINPQRHAFVDHGGAMQDLGTLGGTRSEAYGINDGGLVAGWSELQADADGFSLIHPFLYRDGAMLDLGTLGGGSAYARAINNLGLLVGESEIGGDGPGTHGFLYLDGMLVDLNTLVSGADGWEIAGAYDINDAGQILGSACRLGECVGVRLDLVPAVPEPAAWALLLAGLPLALRRRRP